MVTANKDPHRQSLHNSDLESTEGNGATCCQQPGLRKSHCRERPALPAHDPVNRSLPDQELACPSLTRTRLKGQVSAYLQ